MFSEIREETRRVWVVGKREFYTKKEAEEHTITELIVELGNVSDFGDVIYFHSEVRSMAIKLIGAKTRLVYLLDNLVAINQHDESKQQFDEEIGSHIFLRLSYHFEDQIFSSPDALAEYFFNKLCDLISQKLNECGIIWMTQDVVAISNTLIVAYGKAKSKTFTLKY